MSAKLSQLPSGNTPSNNDLFYTVQSGSSYKVNLGQLFASNSVATYVSFFAGPPQSTHWNHGLFWPKQVSSVQQDLGTAFLWDAWVAPGVVGGSPTGGYLISDGYGGAHSLLWGFAGPATGNVWNGSSAISFGSQYNPALGEWVHAAIGWDGTKLVSYINGIPDYVTLFAGPRKSPGGSSDGFLYVGGSDHSNLTMSLAYLRGWDRFNPLQDQGLVLFGFVPDRFQVNNYLSPSSGSLTPCDFQCDYTLVSKVAFDSSMQGFDSNTGTGKLHHHGRVGNDANGPPGVSVENAYQTTRAQNVSGTWLIGWINQGPQFIIDNTCPFGQLLGTSPVPTGTILTPLPPPSGCKVFDSFQRPNQTFAFQTNPTLGSTESGSLGQIVWNIGAPSPSGSFIGAAPNGCFWGIIGGRAVAIGFGQMVAWIDTGSATQDIRITRAIHTNGTPATDGYGYESGETGIAFHVQDRSNYWSCGWQASGTNGPNGSGVLGVAKVISDTPSTVASVGVTLGTDKSLRVTTSGSTITIYHGTDGVPGTWTQITQITDSSLSTATGAGLGTTVGASSYLNAFARYINFTAF